MVKENSDSDGSLDRMEIEYGGELDGPHRSLSEVHESIRTKFQKFRQELNHWDHLQHQLVSQFKELCSLVKRARVVREWANYDPLSYLDDINQIVGRLVRDTDYSGKITEVSMEKTLAEFHEVVCTIGRVYEESRLEIEACLSELGAEQVHQPIGIKPNLTERLDKLLVLYNMHKSEYLLKRDVVSAITGIEYKPSDDLLCTLERILIAQPRITKDTVDSFLDICL
ncbi:hypothetical protein FH972_015562 [Carpinus fangiana]|uniref:Uncharacterized protein n=1 Tax=Carpinus fangiana TaxID=176857 RepID=A0A5N6RD40_9ROSI|nr:hypothetical protein FH972_015562 [Carpinus fangiana]